MRIKCLMIVLMLVILATILACSSTSNTGGQQSANVPLVVSDASSEDWGMVGVKLLSIALVPQGGGNTVTVYTAPTPAPMINLAQLNQIAEILGNISIPVGTYTDAIVTVSANPGDVALTVSADPGTSFKSEFGAIDGANISSSSIQIQGSQGTSGSEMVTIDVPFNPLLVVSTTQTSAIDIEFDIGHPAFLTGHAVSGDSTLWAVNFNGPLRHHPIYDLNQLIMRHIYGTVQSVSTDNTSVTITKDFPTIPIVTPETAVTTNTSLTILADATNGTLFYDVDAKTVVTIKDFSTVASALPNKYVRVAARYQQNGTLVAARIWASSSFNSIWVSPEGHVMHVDTTNNLIVVSSEFGTPVALTVNDSTQFFFRANTTPVGTGTAFLANIKRGFKVHTSVVDPLATPLVAQTIDIETAQFSGKISNPNSTDFTYTRTFGIWPSLHHSWSDDYTVTLDYIDATTDNGYDSSGNIITGFKYWNFAYPTLADTGANAISDFVAATNGSISFGGTFGSVSAWGVSDAIWGDSANPNGWSVPWTILEPTPLPIGTVASALVNNAFTMSITGGANAVTVDVSTTSGSATLVYQVDRTNGILTVTPIDITTSTGLTTLTNGLAVGTRVRVYSVPQSDGTLKAYVLTYFTGTKPSLF